MLTTYGTYATAVADASMDVDSVMDPEAGSIPVEELELVARAVDEDEDRTATRIFTEAVDDFGMEPVERFTHVTGFQREEDAQASGESQHGRRRVVMSSAASGRDFR